MYSIKNFTPRLYQETILNTAKKKNCLIILPTGLGKTKTAILIAIERLNIYPSSKVLFLTPTKPLADQIYKEFIENTDIDPENISLFTGAIPPKKRQDKFLSSKVIVSTPQGLANDVINDKIDISMISLLVLDEAHRTTGDYDYVFIARQYNKKAKYPRIIGLTASPGSEIEKIKEVCKNAYIEEIEIRTDKDPDVSPYVKELEVEWVKVDLPENFSQIRKYLNNCLQSKLDKLKEYRISTSSNLLQINKKELLNLQRQISAKISSGHKDFILWHAISITSEAIKVHHALELLETQGIYPLYTYLESIFSSGSTSKVKAVKNLLKDLNFKSAYILTQKLYENKIEHPKVHSLKEIIKREIKENSDIKIMIFTQYRDSALMIENAIKDIKEIKPKIFVGQKKKGLTGISQKEQIDIISKFTNAQYNTIISTSIGEEGLDIPKVDLVIFYEPIPSAIRSIQRRGRTARQKEGKNIILLTKNTRDEVYSWISHHKEKRMHSLLDKIKKDLVLEPKDKNENLIKFLNEKKEPKVIVDQRERGSAIIKELMDLGTTISMESIPVGDYIINSEVCIEHKTKKDFVNSIIDGRLINQIREIKDNFRYPILIIEGEEDIYSIRKVHPNAIRGMLSAIAISFQVPILYTKNPQDTAALIYNMVQRMNNDAKKEISLNLERKPLTTKQQQQFILESFPHVGPNTAKSLLKEFKSIKNFVNSKKEDLEKVENLGAKKATDISNILNEEYKED